MNYKLKLFDKILTLPRRPQGLINRQGVMTSKLLMVKYTITGSSHHHDNARMRKEHTQSLQKDYLATVIHVYFSFQQGRLLDKDFPCFCT